MTANAVRLEAPVPSQMTSPEGVPARGTPEYAQYMAAQFDKANGVEPAKQEEKKPDPAPETKEVPKMPDGGFDKFYNKETGQYNWQAHAREVEFKLAQKAKGDPKTEAKPEAKPEEKAEGQTEAPKEEQKDDAKETVEKAGLNWDEITAKVNDTGKLEEGDYEALERIGVPKQIVDSYIEALTVARAANQAKAFEYAGGEDKLNGALNWAATNLDRQEIDAINKQLASANWKLGIDALMARHAKSAKGAGEPKLVTGEPSNGGEAGFSSHAEMIAAINKRDAKGSKLYDVDPAYRAQVREKIARMK